jgi:hypothetical protein
MLAPKASQGNEDNIAKQISKKILKQHDRRRNSAHHLRPSAIQAALSEIYSGWYNGKYLCSYKLRASRRRAYAATTRRASDIQNQRRGRNEINGAATRIGAAHNGASRKHSKSKYERAAKML